METISNLNSNDPQSDEKLNRILSELDDYRKALPRRKQKGFIFFVLGLSKKELAKGNKVKAIFYQAVFNTLRDSYNTEKK